MAAEASSVTTEGGLTLSYMEQGDASELALVLLPGPTESWRSYQPALQQMSLSIRTIAVSQRGHGDSDRPTAGYRVEDFAADVPPLLDALGIDRAVLVGHSGSCLVARRVAIDHPDRVAGLVLEASPSTLHDDPRLTEFIETVVSSLADPIDPAFARSFVVDTSSDAVAPDVQDQLVAEVLKVPARVWRETFGGLLGYNDLIELGRITAPTLLIWGSDDDITPIWPTWDATPAGARLEVIPEAGHLCYIEQPDRFNTIVREFLREDHSS